MEPKGKKAWIIGASSGIGQALAIELARHGADVLLSSRRMNRLKATAEACHRLGVSAEILPLDLANAAALPGAVDKARMLLGVIDILISAAGLGQRGSALETDVGTARRIFETDFWGAVELTRAVVPGMVGAGRGQVVAVTGVLGKFGAPRRSIYSAAKHALHGWFDSLREELLGTGIEITLLVPGWVRTEISEHALEADGREHGAMDWGQRRGISPEECAKRAMPAITRGLPEQLIGGIECGSVYLNRMWPWLFRKILRRRGIG